MRTVENSTRRISNGASTNLRHSPGRTWRSVRRTLTAARAYGLGAERQLMGERARGGVRRRMADLYGLYVTSGDCAGGTVARTSSGKFSAR